MQRRTLGVLLAMVLGGGTASAQIVEYYHLDAVGNIRAITDVSGNVQSAPNWGAVPATGTRDDPTARNYTTSPLYTR